MGNMIYIYDRRQAEYMIKETKADGFNKIGMGTQGDICVSFFNTGKVRNAMTKWSNKENLNE